MTRVTSGWAAAAALAVFLGSAGAAWACSIALWYHAVPENAATGVPLNARVSVLISPGAGSTFVWVREVGGGVEEPVPFTLSRTAGTGHHENVVLIPDAPLAAGADYRVEVDHSGERMEVTRFTTGTAEDAAAPAAPTVEVGEIVPYVPSGDGSGGACYVETGFVRLDARSDEAATFLLREGQQTIASGLPAQMSLSFSCPAKDRHVEATLVAVDLAGNESAPVPVRYTERCEREQPFGCSAAGASGFGLTAALLSLAALWRRRGAGRRVAG